MRVFGFLLGLVLVVAGVASAVYLDLVVFFIGGIKQVIDGATADPVNSGDVAWGLVKAIVFTGLGTAFSFFVLMLPGFGIMGASMAGSSRSRY